MSRPVKQKKYRRPDGRKKIIPEAVGATAHQERTSIGEAVLDLSMKSLDHNNDDNGVLYNGSIRKSVSGTADLKELSGVTTRATVSESLVIEKVPSSGFEERNNNVEQISSLASHKLLREDILPAMASNHKVQRLLNKLMDLLSEYETKIEKSNPAIASAEDKMYSDPPAVDKINPDPTLLNTCGYP
ncbi:hypothetical protein BUALT_Bualt19G0051700 [Buddleja alternifolia]|uniref:Uncharacterized protein n=1 Tax=Buddleja alternifolia TaxID=168488 RepID=A0AAV6W9N8_9LAMI|nr:hypothetical protein BUALT_Bualt19G0051700 [Buddleja alternifolia]